MNRRLFRYSIAGVLFVGAGIAGTLAGYRLGYQRGYSSGEEQRRSEEPVARVYPVGELIRQTSGIQTKVPSQLNFDVLLQATQTSVAPSEWEALGGPSTMTPLPSMEGLVIHATPAIHDQVATFYSDLSKLQTAVDLSRQQQDEMERLQQEWMNGILTPIAGQLNTRLTPLTNNVDLIGTWQMNQHANDSISEAEKYTFVDQGSVHITPANDAQLPNKTWYSRSPGAVVIGGQAFVAATTSKNELVLIHHNQPESFLLGNNVGAPIAPNSKAEAAEPPE